MNGFSMREILIFCIIGHQGKDDKGCIGHQEKTDSSQEKTDQHKCDRCDRGAEGGARVSMFSQFGYAVDTWLFRDRQR
jgi:hypothetical protein